jgi:hypothetical protein
MAWGAINGKLTIDLRNQLAKKGGILKRSSAFYGLSNAQLNVKPPHDTIAAVLQIVT